MKYSAVILLLLGVSNAIVIDKRVAPQQLHLQKTNPSDSKPQQPTATEAPKPVALAPATEKKKFSKAEQLESMELALKQATEETHKKMLEAQKSEKTPEQMLAQSTTMQNLKNKHAAEEKALKEQIAKEEAQHLKEINEMEQYQKSIIKAEEDRKSEQEAQKLHAEEMKLLQ